MIPLQVTVAGKDHKGRVLVTLEFPKARTHHGVINGSTLVVFNHNRFWLPW